MNKFLIRLSTVILSLGMLGAAACSGCMPTTPDAKEGSAVMQQQSMTCGAYTHREGNQCVGNKSGSKNTSTSGSPTTLGTNGNN
jgi:hypothetical protein